MARQRKPVSPLSRAVQKYGVSAFVLGSFAAYAVHEHATNVDSAPASTLPPQATLVQQIASAPTQVPLRPTSAPIIEAPTRKPQPKATIAQPTQIVPTATIEPTVEPTLAPTLEPTAAPVATVSQFKDGTFAGPVVDAYYGNVQVEATIKGGKITDVQFLDYPHDRRTSQRINNVAMPYLMNEAIKAQSANVDVISGATLTSEAFAQSLQNALDTARS